MDERRHFGAILLAATLGMALVVAGCGSDSARGPAVERLGMKNDRLFAVPSTTWPDPSAIPVCWETSGFAEEKGWVKAGIAASWEAAAPHVHFTGWGACSSGSKGIRIAVVEGGDGPHVKELGVMGDGVRDGTVLDLALDPSDPYYAACHESETKRKRCTQSIANHEFGHALGFLHEQERPDTPSSCEKDPTPPEGKKLGAWDLMSIMNYCYPDRDNAWPLSLSPADIKGLLAMYPAPPGDSKPKPASEESGGDDDDDDGAEASAEPRSKKATESGDDEDEDDEDDDEATDKVTRVNAAQPGCSMAYGSSATSGSVSILFLFALTLRRRRIQLLTR